MCKPGSPTLPLIPRVTLQQRRCPHFTGNETGLRRSDLQKAVLLVSGDVKSWPPPASPPSSRGPVQPTCYLRSVSVPASDSKCLSGCLSPSLSVEMCFPFHGFHGWARSCQESGSRHSGSSEMPDAPTFLSACREEVMSASWYTEVCLGRRVTEFPHWKSDDPERTAQTQTWPQHPGLAVALQGSKDSGKGVLRWGGGAVAVGGRCS